MASTRTQVRHQSIYHQYLYLAVCGLRARSVDRSVSGIIGFQATVVGHCTETQTTTTRQSQHQDCHEMAWKEFLKGMSAQEDISFCTKHNYVNRTCLDN